MAPWLVCPDFGDRKAELLKHLRGLFCEMLDAAVGGRQILPQTPLSAWKIGRLV